MMFICFISRFFNASAMFHGSRPLKEAVWLFIVFEIAPKVLRGNDQEKRRMKIASLKHSFTADAATLLACLWRTMRWGISRPTLTWWHTRSVFWWASWCSDSPFCTIVALIWSIQAIACAKPDNGHRTCLFIWAINDKTFTQVTTVTVNEGTRTKIRRRVFVAVSFLPFF